MEAEGSLVIAKVDEEDEAKYQCLAKNVVGTRGSAKAQLSVLGGYRMCARFAKRFMPCSEKRTRLYETSPPDNFAPKKPHFQQLRPRQLRPRNNFSPK